MKFEEKDIFDLLRKMNANKTAGPNGFHLSKLIKMCAKGLAKPLSLLFNRSFETGSIPKKWKMANVVPIFKKGDKSSVDNYRPISLTSLFMKTFEYCIRDFLVLKCNDIILKDNQHGFRSGKSCLTQLIPFVDKLAEALNNASRVNIIYFDFAKAFDTVNHDLILNFGVDGLLLELMGFYCNFIKTTCKNGSNRL